MGWEGAGLDFHSTGLSCSCVRYGKAWTRLGFDSMQMLSGAARFNLSHFDGYPPDSRLLVPAYELCGDITDAAGLLTLALGLPRGGERWQGARPVARRLKRGCASCDRAL